MTGITVGVASTSRPASAHARSPRPRRRRAIPPTFPHRVAGIAHLVLPPLAVAWAAFSLLFAGFATTVVVMFAAIQPGGAAKSDPVSAVDDALGAVAADSGVLSGVFATAPALIAVVHLAGIVLAASVLARPRVGAIARITAGAVLAVTAAAALRFWAGVVLAAELPGPDVVAWVTVFLVPTLVVFVLELAVRAPHRTHRRAPASATSHRNPQNSAQNGPRHV